MTFEPWQWALLFAGAFTVGLAKTGIAGLGIEANRHDLEVATCGAVVEATAHHVGAGERLLAQVEQRSREIAAELFAARRAQVARTMRNRQSPLALLTALQAAVEQPFDQGLQVESALEGTFGIPADRGELRAKAADIGGVYAVSFVVAGLLLLLGRAARKSGAGRFGFSAVAALWTLIIGAGGAILAALWGLTDHQAAHRNENLFLANPLTVLAVPLGIQLMRGSPRAIERLRRLWRVLAALGVYLLRRG